MPVTMGLFEPAFAADSPLTDRDDFDAFNHAFTQTFSEPFPARVTVLAQLIVPGLSIEVTAVAARPR